MSHRPLSRLPSALAGLLLVACAKTLPAEQPCLEARTAIAARSDECTGDPAISGALVDAYDDRATCLMEDLPPESLLITNPVLPYECALATRNLPCELAVDYADDLEAWLATSDTCTAILELSP